MAEALDSTNPAWHKRLHGHLGLFDFDPVSGNASIEALDKSMRESEKIQANLKNDKCNYGLLLGGGRVQDEIDKGAEDYAVRENPNLRNAEHFDPIFLPEVYIDKFPEALESGDSLTEKIDKRVG